MKMIANPSKLGQFVAMNPPKPSDVLQPYVDQGQLAGVVLLVADGSKILSLEAIGYSDLANKVPMKTDAIIWIASQTKPITAALLVMLVDEGELKLDDLVQDFLPEFKELWVAVERDDKHLLLMRPNMPITVRQILSHTAGFEFKSPMETPTLDGLPLRDAVLGYAMTPLKHEPGSKYSYSNIGINTAGRIIEVITGKPYEKFLDERLIQPLGMIDTTFWPTESQVARIAKAYKPSQDQTHLEETRTEQLRLPLSDRTRYPMPAGGLFSTVTDVARFCQMILNNGEFEGRRYLSPESIKKMTTRQTGDLPETYGLGLDTGGGGYHHGGALGSKMRVDPTHKLVTVFHVQHAGYLGDAKNSQDQFVEAAIKIFGNPT